MRFAIESDVGSEIRGWLVADEPSTPGLIRIAVPGREEMQLKADFPRPEIRELGLSPSEFVGFVVDRSVAPGIEVGAQVEIFEAESGAPLYRRPVGTSTIDRKLVLFDVAAAPQRALIEDLAGRFTITCANVERFSSETLNAMLTNSAVRSVALHGRPRLASCFRILESEGFIRAALLRDPFEELAERLLFLNLLAQSARQTLVARFATGLEPLLDFARDLRFDDYKALLGDFRRLTEPQKRSIANPMVRFLGCGDESTPTHEDLSRALDNLASLDVVGVRGRYPAFRSMLTQFLGADIAGLQEVMVSDRTLALAESLSRIGVAVDLLEHDRTLYADVTEAIEEGLTGNEGLSERSNQII